MQEKKVSPLPSGIGLGLGSAFAALPPPPLPLPVDQLTHEGRYLWDPARLHGLHPPPPQTYPGLGGVGSVHGSLELPLVGGGRLGTAVPLGIVPGDLPAPQHPPYGINPYVEHLYQTLHHPTNTSFRGLSPLEGRGLAIGSDYLGMSGVAATRLSDPHLIPSTLTSTDLPFSLDGTRASLLHESIRQSRKRALSSSPYSDSFDINSMIRFSPNSLVSVMNGLRSSSASTGSYGHLSAGAISPVLSMHPGVGAPTHLQQLQAHLIRGGSLPGSPFLAQAPLLHHPPPSTLATHQSLFSLTTPTSNSTLPTKPEVTRPWELTDGKTASPSLSSRLDDKDPNKAKKESSSTTCSESAPSSNSTGRVHEDDGLKDEPPDFVETVCHWKDCTAPNKEFNTQDQLVKHINNDHIHANKKSFICRWTECARDEKPFKAQYMLVVHVRRHTGEKPHSCTFESCFKAYSRLENLKTHLRSHTGERPYNCEFPGCTKAFSNASDRAKHQNRTHSNEKPYVCKAPGCTKRYTDPSSLRKHVKTVHGDEFYNSKKHKGNDHPSANGGTPDGDKDGGATEGSPHSDGGKGPLSSPSIKSEGATSPGQQNSPSMDAVVVGGSTPMDQSRLMANGPTSAYYNSTTGGFESLLENGYEWDAVDDDLDANVGLPVGLSLGGDGSVSGAITAQERYLRNCMKNRLQAKGLVNILPNIPYDLRHSPGGMMGTPAFSDISQQITDLRMKAGMNTPQQNNRKLMELQFQLNQTTMMQNNRRDSNSTVSTYYGSMKSGMSGESPLPCSRRSSQFSQISNGPDARQHILESPCDQGYGSRRSSENSNFNRSGIAQSMANHLAKLQRRAMLNNEMCNTSNLVVQTQKMSLSQDNLQCGWGNGMDQTLGGQQRYFGSVEPIGPLDQDNNKSSDGVQRRASDPVRSLDRGFSNGNGRIQRHHSYSNFNQHNNMSNNTPHHPNHGLKLDQVAEDEPIENKLVLPDDMVNYLNQKDNKEKSDPKEDTQSRRIPYSNSGIPSPTYITGNLMPSPAYNNQNMLSLACSNQKINSPASNYPFNSLGHPLSNYQTMTPGTPQHQPSNTNMPSPATPSDTLPAQANPSLAQGPQFYQVNNGGYNQQPANFPMQQQQMNQQYPQQQYTHQQMMIQQHQQIHGPMMQQQENRFLNNGMTPQGSYNMDGQGCYGPVHACGHSAQPNLPPPAYQAVCAGCQNSSKLNGTNAYHGQQGNWQGSQVNMNQHYPMPQQYGPQFNSQHMGMMGNTGNQQYHRQGIVASGQMMNRISQFSADVQCKDVSQSTQSKRDKVIQPAKKTNDPQHEQNENYYKLSMSEPTDTLSKDVKDEYDTKNIDTKKDMKSFMGQDKYRRTLNYVKQCQTWGSTPVKVEVTSTTDQKPKLNPNGTVVGYTDPGSQGFVAPHHPESCITTPLPTPLSQNSNMVINDMSSSLTSLQEENKYLKMLQ